MSVISRLLRLRERWRYKAEVMICGDLTNGIVEYTLKL